MTKTDWFHSPAQPFLHGVYERRFDSGIGYSYWDGRRWYFVGHTPEEAVTQARASMISQTQQIAWRGLTREEHLKQLQDVRYVEEHLDN
jgi:hypothetical protein